ncbi:unnamed protein product, partial [Discosporangium mesarthrocarpum]
RQEEGEEEEREGGESRVEKLAAFQLAALLKAMSFPQVERVCYSTCSIYRAENEDVIVQALLHQEEPLGAPKGALGTTGSSPGPLVPPLGGPTPAPAAGDGAGQGQQGWRPFRLVPCLPQWHRRGLAGGRVNEEMARCMVRANPLEDRTNGFFVAVLSRAAVAAPGLGAGLVLFFATMGCCSSSLLFYVCLGLEFLILYQPKKY